MEEDVKKYTGIYSLVPKKYRENTPGTKEMDYLHGVNEKEGGEKKGKWGSRNEDGGGLSESIFFV